MKVIFLTYFLCIFGVYLYAVGSSDNDETNKKKFKEVILG